MIIILFCKKDETSEVASKRFDVPIAEGLQLYPSYDRYLKLKTSEKQSGIIDKTLSSALYRALKEELDINDKEIQALELLSIYYDYELQQPIFQTCTYLNISSEKLRRDHIAMSGRDTLKEITRWDFVPLNLDKILLYLYEGTQEGKWNPRAILNLISFLEKNFGSEEKLKPALNKYFSKSVEFYSGEQRFVENIRK